MDDPERPAGEGLATHITITADAEVIRDGQVVEQEPESEDDQP